jgi:peptidoglycan DL-endopeptidase CwlO
LSDRDLARHRSPQRPVTFLTDAGEAVSGRIAVVGRTGAVLAASTGMLATGGLPASGASAASAPVTSADASAGTRTMLGGVSARLLSAPVARSTPLSAPMTATVTFETSAFRASPAPRRMISPAKVTALIRAVPARRTTAPAEAAPNRQATPAKATPAKAAPAKAAPDKSAEESSTRTSAAPPKRSKHVEAAPKSSKKTDAAPKRSKHAAPPKRSKPVEAPKKKPRASKPATKAPAGSARGSAVLAVAARYVGTPYVYGGSTPRGFDCSGFTSYVYRQLGISLPRTANQQMQATRRVSRSQARAGDLVFFVSANRAYHVGIYAGNGKMYDSPRSGKRVSKRAIWDAAVVFGRVTR